MLSISLPDARAVALPELTSPTQYLLQRWTVADGLPESEVMGITQTNDGFLWCVTRNHLVRFNGRKFETVPDERYLSELRTIGPYLGVATDAHGALWVMGGRGAGCWDGRQWRIYPGRQYHSLVRTENGRNWFYTIDGLVLIENNQVRSIPFGPDVPVEGNILAYSASCRPGQPELWLARISGLYRFLDGGYQAAAIPMQDRLAKAVYAGPRRLWLGCGERVAWRESGGWILLPPLSQPRTDEIRALFESRDGTLWAGTRRAVRCWHGRNWTTMVREDPGFPVEIRKIFEDGSGNIWMACGGGLLCFKKRIVQVFGNGLVQCAWEHRDGEVWLASAVDVVTASTGERPLRDKGLPNGVQVTAMLQSRGGAIWLGTQGDGLYRIKGGRSERIEPDVHCPIPASNISALCEDSQGHLWIGAWNGLLQFDPYSRNLRILATEHNRGKVTMLWRDVDGTVWAGVQSQGLLKITVGPTTQSWHWLNDGVPGSEIYDMLRDGQGTLWIAGNGGLARWGADGSRFILTADKGLADNVVRQLASDRDGALWLGTRLGIQRLMIAELDALAAGRRPRIEGILLGRDAGIAEPVCLGGFHTDCNQVARDQLWFPTMSGLIKIDPSRIVPATQTPIQVYLESVRTRNGTPYEITGLLPGSASVTAGPVELSVRNRPIEISYGAAAPSRTEAPRFACRMAGLEESWSPISGNTVAVYPALPAGRYRFEVIVPPECGGSRRSIAAIDLIVQPVFWQTWWFLGLLTVASSTLVALLVRWVLRRRYRRRVRELKREQALQLERARIARDMHDEIGAGLTSLAMSSDMAKARCTTLEAAAEHFGRIFQQARGLTQALDEIVWAVNPVNDTLEQMVSYLVGIACETLEPAEIRYRITVPDPLPAMIINSRLRHQICLVAQEALTNIIKHARAREVMLQMALTEGVFSLSLRDDGSGFDLSGLKTLPSGHDGLSNMRSRMEEIGGKLELDSAPGQGTHLRLSVILTTDASWPDDVRMR